MFTEAMHIIGFDLGHGKTALAWVDTDHKNEPEVLEIGTRGEKWEITAIARNPQNEVLIGDAALRRAEVVEFDIGFKRRPSKMSRDDRRDVCDFAEFIYRRALQKTPFPAQIHTLAYVGCPSGWSKDEVDAYEQLLTGASIPNLRVVPESRAAMMHAKESGKLRVAELKGWCLVVDIGSSTTDFTLVLMSSNEQIAFDTGVDLGGSLLDRAILIHSLADPELKDRQAFADRVERSRSDRNRLELTCREVKEKYFRQPENYQGEEDTPYARVKIDGIGYFVPRLNKRIMDEVLSLPLPELIDPQEGTAGQAQTWPGAFRHELNTIADKVRREGLDLRTILLTGGGSRMPFVEQICHEVFDNTPLIDHEPELCIARGLARYGHMAVRMKMFQADANAFLDQHLATIVKSNLPDLINGLAESLADDLTNQVVAADLRAWQDGNIKSKDLEARIAKDMQDWLVGPACQRRMVEQQTTYVGDVYRKLEEGIDQILAQSNLPRGLVHRSDDELEIASGGVVGGLQVDGLGRVNTNAWLAVPIGSVTTFAIIAAIPASILVMTILPALLISLAVGGLSFGVVKRRFSDARINKLLTNMKQKLVQACREKLNNDTTWQRSLTDSIEASMRSAVDEKVATVMLLIS